MSGFKTFLSLLALLALISSIESKPVVLNEEALNEFNSVLENTLNKTLSVSPDRPHTHLRIPISSNSNDEGTHFRGVCIGGWLVLESWITPSIFAPYLNITMSNGHAVWDEYSLAQYLGPDAGAQVLHAHWDQWVSEAEIAEIAQAGITHVRVPVGYWIVNPQPGEPWISKGI